jgi:DNA-binding response OmpR family regulator
MSTILIVEDQASVAEVVRYHLENSGYDAVIAADVESAWQLVVAESPTAAVVDIKLNGADGWTFLERVRSDGRFSDMPAIVLTGLLEPEIIEKAASLGCQYLSKPFAASALMNKLEHLLREREAHSRDNGRGPSNGHRPSPADGNHKIKLTAQKVVVLLEGYEVEGMVHIPPELPRFSDAWEATIRDPREFLPITEAKITIQGQNSVARSAFLQVRKSKIQAIFPQE